MSPSKLRDFAVKTSEAQLFINTYFLPASVSNPDIVPSCQQSIQAWACLLSQSEGLGLCSGTPYICFSSTPCVPKSFSRVIETFQI